MDDLPAPIAANAIAFATGGRGPDVVRPSTETLADGHDDRGWPPAMRAAPP